MNFLWLTPALITALAYIPKRKKKEYQVINEVLRNRNVGVRSQSGELMAPKMIKRYSNELYTTLIYKLPLGLPSDVFKSLKDEISEGLNREIESEYSNGIVKIRVFNHALTTKFNFDKRMLKPNTWKVPIGTTHSSIIHHDFDEYPHLLTGGVTRFGKTVLLKLILNSLILNRPDDVEVYILDLKAGLEFHKYLQFEQVKAVACDLKESADLLAEIVSDMKESEHYFRDKGYSNITETPIKKRKFIIVDEGAELSPYIIKSRKDRKTAEFCQACLSEIARIGGGIGYRLIFATQYPTKDAVPMQVKMNIVSRLSFVCASTTASQVILDSPDGMEIPSIPGRAIYQIDKPKMIQVPYLDDKSMSVISEKNVKFTKNNTEKPINNSENSENAQSFEEIVEIKGI